MRVVSPVDEVILVTAPDAVGCRGTVLSNLDNGAIGKVRDDISSACKVPLLLLLQDVADFRGVSHAHRVLGKNRTCIGLACWP